MVFKILTTILTFAASFSKYFYFFLLIYLAPQVQFLNLMLFDKLLYKSIPSETNYPFRPTTSYIIVETLVVMIRHPHIFHIHVSMKCLYEITDKLFFAV